MYYVNLSQWREELGPVIKSIQDHMRADRKNGSNELSKKKKKKIGHNRKPLEGVKYSELWLSTWVE